MTDHYHQSIAALVAKIEQDEQTFFQGIAKRKMLVNELCGEAGVEPRFPNVSETTSAPTPRTTTSNASIKSDEFFGKPLAGSIKRVLELRRVAGNGPAMVEEIYRTLVQGGYSFGGKPEVAIQGLTVSIGKNSAVFIKLPNGQIALKEWYPNVRLNLRKRGESATNGEVIEEQQEENK